MTDLLVGATAGTSQQWHPNHHSPLSHADEKHRTFGNGSDTGASRFVMPYRRKAVLMRLPALLCQEG